MNIRKFNSDWLNVEQLYENAGWKVDYDRPGYNEIFYEAQFIFRKVGRYD